MPTLGPAGGDSERDPADLRDVAAALGDRSNVLAEEGRAAEIPALWEEAIAGFADYASRARVILAYAWYQVLHGEIPAGVALAAGLLDEPSAPGPVRAQARVLLRSRWREDPAAVEEAWHKSVASPVPDWFRLQDAEIQAVVDWISTATWEESRAHYRRHADRLRAPGTDAVLDELALTGHAELIGRHRTLLAQGRAGQIEAAYRLLLLGEAVRAWLAMPDWTTSRCFLEANTILLEDDVPGLLARSGGDAAGVSIGIHRAILVLASGASGTEGAYRCVTDVVEAEAAAAAAASRDEWAGLHACGTIEVLVHRRAFLGSVHVVIAEAMTDAQTALRPRLLERLGELAAAASTSERERAVADIRTVLSRTPGPGQSAIAELLRNFED